MRQSRARSKIVSDIYPMCVNDPRFAFSVGNIEQLKNCDYFTFHFIIFWYTWI